MMDERAKKAFSMLAIAEPDCPMEAAGGQVVLCGTLETKKVGLVSVEEAAA